MGRREGVGEGIGKDEVEKGGIKEGGRTKRR